VSNSNRGKTPKHVNSTTKEIIASSSENAYVPPKTATSKKTTAQTKRKGTKRVVQQNMGTNENNPYVHETIENQSNTTSS